MTEPKSEGADEASDSEFQITAWQTQRWVSTAATIKQTDKHLTMTKGDIYAGEYGVYEQFSFGPVQHGTNYGGAFGHRLFV